MAIRELFLPLISYPVPTSASAIKAVIDLAENLNHDGTSGEKAPKVHVRICALVLETEIESGLYYEGAHIGEFLDTESKRSAQNALELADSFGKLTKNRNVLTNCRVVKRSPYEGMKLLIEEARLHHLTVLPVGKDNEQHQNIAEYLIFDSGRPVLIFPENLARPIPTSFKNIAVAWDGSRPAARSVADAMPFLRRATQVRIFSATDDKPMQGASRGAVIADQLNSEGTFAIYEEVSKNDAREIGNFMERYMANHSTDLLVMGAFGHSRFREFILGGATSSILMNPPGWVMLSH